MAELQQCHSCRWGWHMTTDVDGLSGGVGECHRHAPRAKFTSSDSDFTTWPKVFSDDGCGDWTSRMA